MVRGRRNRAIRECKKNISTTPHLGEMREKEREEKNLSKSLEKSVSLN